MDRPHSWDCRAIIATLWPLVFTSLTTSKCLSKRSACSVHLHMARMVDCTLDPSVLIFIVVCNSKHIRSIRLMCEKKRNKCLDWKLIRREIQTMTAIATWEIYRMVRALCCKCVCAPNIFFTVPKYGTLRCIILFWRQVNAIHVFQSVLSDNFFELLSDKLIVKKKEMFYCTRVTM